MRPAIRAIVLGGLDRDALAWKTAVLAAGGTVTSAQVTLVSILIRRLKAAGVWTILDRLWLFAAENATQALTDLVARSTATAVNSPTFTASQGYAGNGTTSYVNSGFKPSTDAVQGTLNSSSFGFYCRTNRTVGANYSHGANTLGATVISPFWSDNIQYFDVNDGASNTHAAPATVKGMWAVVRTASTVLRTDQNGVPFATGTQVSNAMASANLFFGAISNSGTAGDFGTDQIAMAFAGGGLTAAQSLAFYTAFQAYMTSLGTQV